MKAPAPAGAFCIGAFVTRRGGGRALKCGRLLTGLNIRLDSSDPAVARIWSCPAPPPSRRLRCDRKTHVTTLETFWGVEREWTDPLEALHWLSSHEAGFSNSRWVGWISYDAGRLFEDVPMRSADDLGLPLFEFTYHSEDEYHLPVLAEVVRRRDDPRRWNFTRE